MHSFIETSEKGAAFHGMGSKLGLSGYLIPRGSRYLVSKEVPEAATDTVFEPWVLTVIWELDLLGLLRTISIEDFAT